MSELQLKQLINSFLHKYYYRTLYGSDYKYFKEHSVGKHIYKAYLKADDLARNISTRVIQFIDKVIITISDSFTSWKERTTKAIAEKCKNALEWFESSKVYPYFEWWKKNYFEEYTEENIRNTPFDRRAPDESLGPNYFHDEEHGWYMLLRPGKRVYVPYKFDKPYVPRNLRNKTGEDQFHYRTQIVGQYDKFPIQTDINVETDQEIRLDEEQEEVSITQDDEDEENEVIDTSEATPTAPPPIPQTTEEL
jgi:hypothetical protein